jgi:hypothetical protein
MNSPAPVIHSAGSARQTNFTHHLQKCAGKHKNTPDAPPKPPGAPQGHSKDLKNAAPF